MPWSRKKDCDFITDLRAYPEKHSDILRQLSRHQRFRESTEGILIAGGGNTKQHLKDFLFGCLSTFSVRARHENVLENFSSLEQFSKAIAKYTWAQMVRSSDAVQQDLLNKFSRNQQAKNIVFAQLRNYRNEITLEKMEDLFHDGWITFQKKITSGGYEGGSLQGLLASICINEWNNQNRKKRITIDKAETLKEEVDFPDLSESPIEKLINANPNDPYDKAFSQLTKRCKTVFLKIYYADIKKNYTEIAEEMSLKNGQIVSNLHSRCKGDMATFYKEQIAKYAK